jgi:hypothetical protein
MPTAEVENQAKAVHHKEKVKTPLTTVSENTARTEESVRLMWWVRLEKFSLEGDWALSGVPTLVGHAAHSSSAFGDQENPPGIAKQL